MTKFRSISESTLVRSSPLVSGIWGIESRGSFHAPSSLVKTALFDTVSSGGPRKGDVRTRATKILEILRTAPTGHSNDNTDRDQVRTA